MKPQWIILSALASLFSGAQAQADSLACCRPTPNWYAAIRGGAVFLNDTESTVSSDIPAFDRRDKETYSVGFDFGGAVGYKVLPYIRTEGEVLYQRSRLDKVNGAKPTFAANEVSAGQRNLAFMGNAYYDWNNSTRFTPYLGAGLGEAHSASGIGYGSVVPKDWGFAYQFLAGVSYNAGNALSPVAISLGYRYFHRQDTERDLPGYDATINVPDVSNSLELGVGFYF